jgi:hypothetical protein
VRVQTLLDEPTSATMSAEILLSDLSTKRVLVQVKTRLEALATKIHSPLFILLMVSILFV